MSMTRKHYVFFANDLNDVLRQSLPDTIKVKAETIYEIAVQLSTTFKSENPKFDRARFLDAAFEGFEQYRPDSNRN
jgi:hypothetical protein